MCPCTLLTSKTVDLTVSVKTPSLTLAPSSERTSLVSLCLETGVLNADNPWSKGSVVRDGVDSISTASSSFTVETGGTLDGSSALDDPVGVPDERFSSGLLLIITKVTNTVYG